MKIGVVIPWFGRELKGGAEQQACNSLVGFLAVGMTCMFSLLAVALINRIGR